MLTFMRSEDLAADVGTSYLPMLLTQELNKQKGALVSQETQWQPA